MFMDVLDYEFISLSVLRENLCATSYLIKKNLNTKDTKDSTKELKGFITNR
jgi:hypothetical protein